MEDNYYADTSVYYANQVMVDENLVMSMSTHLVYDISTSDDVRIIKRVDDSFFVIAQKDIENDGPCFYGMAAIYREMPEEGCEVGNLIWEL